MLTTMMSRCGLSCFIPRLPKQPKVVFTAYIFTEQQVENIFEVADNMRLYDIRMGTALIAIPAILHLLYSTGLRVSEALSLKNCDIDLQTGCLMVRKTKNGSERIVALSSSMKTVLADYLYNRDRMPVADVSNPDKPVFIKSIQTTDIYARADSKAKREALEKAYRGTTPAPESDREWERNKDLLDWLNGLGR